MIHATPHAVRRPGPLICSADVKHYAAQVSRGLPAEQRAAVAVELIRSISEPESFLVVRDAARIVQGHGNALLSDAMRVVEGQSEHTTVASLTDQSATVSPVARGTAGTPRSRRLSPLSAAWARFRVAERRFSDSIWGDALAGVFALGALFGLSIILWGLQ